MSTLRGLHWTILIALGCISLLKDHKEKRSIPVWREIREWISFIVLEACIVILSYLHLFLVFQMPQLIKAKISFRFFPHRKLLGVDHQVISLPLIEEFIIGTPQMFPNCSSKFTLPKKMVCRFYIWTGAMSTFGGTFDPYSFNSFIYWEAIFKES